MRTQITNAQQKLPGNKIDALLISSAYNIGYLTGFFGFSKTEREGYALLTKNQLYVFASGLNNEAIKKHIERSRLAIELVEISSRSPLTKKVLANIIKQKKIKRLGFEKHSLLFSEYERLQKDLAVSLVPTEHIVEQLRMIKDEYEIEAIEKACRLGDQAFTYVLTKIKQGIPEKELAFEIENFFRGKGFEPSFPTIVAFGENSAVPHHMTDDKRLIANSWVLMDFGVYVNNYCSDMTRTVFFGKVSTEQRRMYNAVLNAQQKAFQLLTSNFSLLTSHHKTVKASLIDKTARQHITSNGFPTIPHSLGHGIGLEVHEPPKVSPKSKDILKPNMVFSIEPGIYLPGVGGVRIEDLVVLESSNPRYLTKAKRELIEISA